MNLFEWYAFDEIMAVGDDYDEDAFEFRLEIKGSDDHTDLRNVLTKLRITNMLCFRLMETVPSYDGNDSVQLAMDTESLADCQTIYSYQQE